MSYFIVHVLFRTTHYGMEAPRNLPVGVNAQRSPYQFNDLRLWFFVEHFYKSLYPLFSIPNPLTVS
jgi:hypothetical protein